MPAITIEGKNRSYIFSVVEANYNDMPDWGGVYIAVKSVGHGIRMEDCVEIGSCSNFKEYQSHISKSIGGRCTHLYLLPEFEANQRRFALEDLMHTHMFNQVHAEILGNDEVRSPISLNDAPPDEEDDTSFSDAKHEGVA